MIALSRFVWAVALLTLGVLLPAPNPVTAQTAAAAGYEGEVSGRLERILQRERLIIGVRTDYPPWGMIGEGGAIVGLEPDLARDLAARLGVGLELVAVSATNRLQWLEQGRVDLVIATVGDTEERQGISDLLQPHYYASGVRLLAREGSLFSAWGQLRGQTVCFVDGTQFNRTLVERFLVRPLVLAGNREAVLALQNGRCVGWAFDESVLAQLVRAGEVPGYAPHLPAILTTRWTIAVAKGEGTAPLGQIVSDSIADWHRTGAIARAEATWGLPPSGFVARQSTLWSAKDADGALVCQRGADGGFPSECLSDRIALDVSSGIEVPPWAAHLGGWLGLSPDLLFDSYTRSRFAGGLGVTVLLSAVAIVGALVFGVAAGWLDTVLWRRGGVAWLLRLPLQAVFAVARMTPPILQLYMVFFGLGALMASSYAMTPGAFLTAAVVFSAYAGSANALLVAASLRHMQARHPERSLTALLPEATERVSDGLTASCVTIVKAAGLASTIAVTEVISVANTLIAEGGDARTVMNLLLVFYLLFVLGAVWLFGAIRRRLVAHRARAGS